MEGTFSGLNQAWDKIQESGFSTFFAVSSVLSLCNGKKNRDNALEKAKEDEAFQLELQRQKERYDDEKEAVDLAFKLWLKNQQREFSRLESTKKFENEISKHELEKLFEDWPLELSIYTILQSRKTAWINGTPLNFIIAKYSTGGHKDPLLTVYSDIVEDIIKDLRGLYVDNARVYRFKENSKVNGGAALANIYAMMNCFPSIVVLPHYDGIHQKLNLSVAIWSQDSPFPLQKRALSLDYEHLRATTDRAYFLEKKEEITYSFLTIYSVLNDAFQMLEVGVEPRFPEYASKITLSDGRSLKEKYPALLQFAKRELLSLIDTNNTVFIDGQSTILSDNMDLKKKEELEMFINNSLNLL